MYLVRYLGEAMSRNSSQSSIKSNIEAISKSITFATEPLLQQKHKNTTNRVGALIAVIDASGIACDL
jgi:hypothetical protein